MIVEVKSLTQPGLEVFSTLTEAQLRNKLEPRKGIFIAESPKVIQVALDNHYEPLSLLCERRHIEGDAASIIAQCGDIPVYTGDRELLANLTGYQLTRGVLCAFRRPVLRRNRSRSQNPHPRSSCTGSAGNDPKSGHPGPGIG